MSDRQKLSEPPVPCKLGFRWAISECPYMKMRPGDRDMEYEHYDCIHPPCGHHDKLDYEEMK